MDPSYNYYANITNNYISPELTTLVYIITTNVLLDEGETTVDAIFNNINGVYGIDGNENIEFNTVTGITFFGSSYSQINKPVPYNIYVKLEQSSLTGYILLESNLHIPARAYNILMNRNIIDSFGDNKSGYHPVFANSRLPLWQK